MLVQILHNVEEDAEGRSMGMARGYEDGDKLQLVFRATKEQFAPELASAYPEPSLLLEKVYEVLNIGEKGVAALYRSMHLRSLSVGDVVVLKDGSTRVWSVGRFGFKSVETPLNVVEG